MAAITPSRLLVFGITLIGVSFLLVFSGMILVWIMYAISRRISSAVTVLQRLNPKLDDSRCLQRLNPELDDSRCAEVQYENLAAFSRQLGKDSTTTSTPNEQYLNVCELATDVEYEELTEVQVHTVVNEAYALMQ